MRPSDSTTNTFEDTQTSHLIDIKYFIIARIKALNLLFT